MAGTIKKIIQGNVGNIEITIDTPTTEPIGIALVAHPHPLFGGTMDNKVTQTLARTLVGLGYINVRHNFRGVGQTDGEHDNGVGELQDSLSVIDWMRAELSAELPLVLAGFSFGSFVQSHVAQALVAQNKIVQRMVMVGTAAGKWQVADVAADAIVIHGELDDVIPLDAVMRWAQPQSLPVTVIAGAGHFFHGDLAVLKQVIQNQW